MREFDTAVKAVTDDPEEVESGSTFKINERDENGDLIRSVECRYFRPSDGQIAMVMASVGRHANNAAKMAGIIDFFVAVLDEESHYYIVDRLMDREDPFGLEEVEQIMAEMIEEWTGRPIQPLSASTQSRSSGGRKSAPRTTKSTSSRSALTPS